VVATLGGAVILSSSSGGGGGGGGAGGEGPTVAIVSHTAVSGGVEATCGAMRPDGGEVALGCRDGNVRIYTVLDSGRGPPHLSIFSSWHLSIFEGPSGISGIIRVLSRIIGSKLISV
jgi:hypothetical protein